MIKFFRKIRQKLLSENKLSKYLIYAIGEIILVVIGILIALSINNWNENRINNRKEQVLLSNLSREFKTNLEKLKSTINKNNNNLDNSLVLLKLVTPNPNKTNEHDISEFWVNSIAQGAFYRPNLVVLNESQNSGNLNLLKNEKLRLLIGSWKSNLDEVSRIELIVEESRERCFETTRELGNFRHLLVKSQVSETGKIISESYFKDSNHELLQSELFENDLVKFIGTTRRFDEFLNTFKETTELCIEILDNEINIQ